MEKLSFKKERKLYLGVELELESPNQFGLDNGDEDFESRLNKAIYRNPKFSPLLMGTCEDGGGLELKFNPMTLEYIKRNKLLFIDLLVEAQKHNPVVRSREAGMHVHIDRSAFTSSQFSKLICFLSNAKQLTTKFANRSPGHSYRESARIICKPLKKDDVSVLTKNISPLLQDRTVLNPEEQSAVHNALFSGSSYRTNLHSRELYLSCIALNRKGYPTIEFRLFNSTIDPIVFFANIEFVHIVRYFVATHTVDELSVRKFLEYVERKQKQYPHLWLQIHRFGIRQISKKKMRLLESSIVGEEFHVGGVKPAEKVHGSRCVQKT